MCVFLLLYIFFRTGKEIEKSVIFSDFYCTLNEYFRSSRRFRECVLDNTKVRATRNYDFMQVL